MKKEVSWRLLNCKAFPVHFPVSVAVNIYVDNGKFQRNIDISREDYSFTRYLPAME
ncbi:hypothetical protein [Siminovitchia fordii]|uniref:hypothetical protein n=1 Tax=Siminovitchia fordii TaxID=254759 RepID=UPI00035F8BF9|nr:hypothetical protein [Siminovitchia fordii]